MYDMHTNHLRINIRCEFIYSAKSGCCFRKKRGEWIAVIFCMSSYMLKNRFLNEFIYMQCTITFVLYESILCMNSYIQTNFAIEEAADIELAAAAADDSIATDMSGVSISDDAEGNIKAVLGDKKADVVEASAPTAAPTVVAVAPSASAADVASATAVAAPAVVLEKKGVSGLPLSFA
jgi:hypothetical protein